MQLQRGLVAAGSCLLLLQSPPPGLAYDSADTVPAVASPQAILEAAFTNRYSINLVSRIELTMIGRGGQHQVRTLEVATKVVDGKVYSIGRLLSPEYLRDMTVLMMEKADRSEDAFIFLPSLGKVRRITTAQKSDAFFGSDVTYEDLEQQRASDFEFDSIEEGLLENERVHQIRARPIRRGNYDHALFVVAQKDLALLKIQYYKRNSDEPYRVIDAPREHMVTLGGHVLPTRIHVENRMRGTRTELLLTKMSTETEIPDRIFSISTLESKSPIPQMR